MKKLFTGILLFLASCGMHSAIAEDSRPFTVLLDSGHTPRHQGALGVRGIYEVTYNDLFVVRLAKALRDASFTVTLTRQPDESPGLMDRVAIANKGQYDLLISIHHDSAQHVYLEKNEKGYQTIKPIAGYSIFVSKTNPRFTDSFRFAEILGDSLLTLGRAPTLHHAEAIPGEGRELLNAQSGIYRFDNLAVLGKTRIPAVLLEIGVIVDADDERTISDEKYQDKLCLAIVKAIQEYARQDGLTSKNQ